MPKILAEYQKSSVFELAWHENQKDFYTFNKQSSLNNSAMSDIKFDIYRVQFQINFDRGICRALNLKNRFWKFPELA